MDEPQEVVQENKTPKSGVMKTVIAILILFAVVLIGGAYWFGKNQGTNETKSVPTIQLEATPTDQPVPTINVPPISPTSTPKPTNTPKPTPTSTPKPTPTNTPTPTPNIQTLIVTSTATLDGFRSSNNGGNNSIEIRAGRNSNLTTRGFVSFNIPTSTLAGKTIDSAKIRLFQYQVIGDPYGVGGSLLVDSLDYGGELAGDDYNRSAISSGTAVLTSNSTLEWKDAGVTEAFKADLTAGRSRSQYRIRFATENIGGTVAGDFAYFYSSNPGSNTNPPQLEIRYH